MFPTSRPPSYTAPVQPQPTTSAASFNPDDVACWEAWRNEISPKSREYRGVAVTSIKNMLKAGDGRLLLYSLNLSSLPHCLPPYRELSVERNRLTSLDIGLPEGLELLCLRHNELQSLPEHLPDTLKVLDISHNPITHLPEKLPASLEKLDISCSGITELPPNLPDSLKILRAESVTLHSLPEKLPDGLKELDVSLSAINRLPARLPGRLEQLKAMHNYLQALPDELPASLRDLDVSHNRLRQLPTMPRGLRELRVQGNPLCTLIPLPDGLRYLNAGHCQLSALPAELPHSLTQLLLEENQLDSLPRQLPENLERLNVNRNLLTQLPSRLPVTLRSLKAVQNPLSRLPDPLPPLLEYLDVYGCLLTALPETIPCGLHVLYATQNRLTTLPEHLYRLPRSCTIRAGLNPFDTATLARLEAIRLDASSTGPQIYYSLTADENSFARPLAHEVAAWFPLQQRATIEGQWKNFNTEPNAAPFGLFLHRLGKTVNARWDNQFCATICDWLARLADSPRLREKTFLLAQESTSSCEDRITLYLNEMKKLELATDIESGKYDNCLPTLMTLARQLFRLEKLEDVARAKVQSLRAVDEIEVWLAYQVRLREILKLDIVAKGMRFFDVSGVSREDLARALVRVQRQELKQFPGWLASWPLWQAVVQRLNPERYAMAARQRDEVVSEFFPQLVNQEALEMLRNAQLEADADASRDICKQVLDRRLAEIDLALSNDFLTAHQLNWQTGWPEASYAAGPSRQQP